jgi:nitroimidazol reductase NimA-like FMN-containing flavoprotein (pyridoxamine 5'-phosphate oxidase superfamily)
MARPREQRIKDTLELLQTEVDVWIATASGAGKPYLVPLSFYWSGYSVLLPNGSRRGEATTPRNFATEI